MLLAPHYGPLRRGLATVLLALVLALPALAATPAHAPAAPAAAPAPAAPAAAPVDTLPDQINAIGDKAADAVVQRLADQSRQESWQRTALLLAAIVVAAVTLDRLARALWRRALGKHLSTTQRHRIHIRLAWLRHTLLGGITLAVTLVLIQSLGVDVLRVLGSDWGRHILSAAINIIVMLVGAVVVWEVLRATIERYLTATDAEGNPLHRSGRTRTLLPLARNATFMVLVTMVGLIVLSELGVNIAPLLAGAGVLGIAIGFGSQKLVQDIITGAFILFEDTIAIGDTVKLGEHAGTVEALSVRAIRLRDAAGALHTIPFGAVSTVINSSRGFNYAVFDVQVPHGRDTEEMAALLNEIGAGMQTDERWGAAMIEPLEVLGVERFDPQAVIVRARIKTMPAERFALGREFNRRLKKAFQEHGIAFPMPEQRVWLAREDASAVQ